MFMLKVGVSISMSAIVTLDIVKKTQQLLFSESTTPAYETGDN